MSDFFIIISSEERNGAFHFNVKINPEHKVFKGHFPNQPIVPGVFSIDMIRQCLASIADSGAADKANKADIADKVGRFHSIKQCKFLQPIIPRNDQILQIEIRPPQVSGAPMQATIFENDKPVLKLKATLLNVAVIIPTYNNEKTIAKIIDDVKHYVDNIIVFNDGSTDGTGEILRNIHGITLLQHSENKGKGVALKTALRHALTNGFTHAITVDADGQHKASDIPKFLDELASGANNTLLIGARNLHAENMPQKNTFANKFSNFWIWAETGVRLQDTQSGFRLYPLEPLRKTRFITRHYDFEVEAMVRLSWKGVQLKNIPIEVYYPPSDERVSHFKPFKDFMRIGALNFLLVNYAILWTHPTRFFRQFSWKNFIHTKDSNIKISLSVGTGVAFGILPVWGYQMVLAGVTAITFKLNKLITVAASNISIPPMIPIILYASYAIGGLIMGRPLTISFSDISLKTLLEAFATAFLQYIAGSFILAGTAGFVFGIICYVFLTIFRPKK